MTRTRTTFVPSLLCAWKRSGAAGYGRFTCVDIIGSYLSVGETKTHAQQELCSCLEKNIFLYRTQSRRCAARREESGRRARRNRKRVCSRRNRMNRSTSETFPWGFWFTIFRPHFFSDYSETTICVVPVPDPTQP